MVVSVDARQRWLEPIEAAIPPREDVLARNAAITAIYARWYLEHPRLCKWAGMAVTASFNVGGYLERLLTDPRLARVLPEETRLAQVALVSHINNLVFEDVAWTHLAYLAPGGGLAAVEAGLEALPTHDRLREGFQRIEAGRARQEADPAEAAAQVWAGNRLLLLHEQQNVVQPHFEQSHALLSLLLSLTARTDYRLGDPRIRQGSSRSFARFTLGRAQRPDIARFEQRWAWIDAEALPCWRALDETGSRPLHARMRELAERWSGRLAP